MPTPTDILRTLSSISNDLTILAIVWHVLLALVIFALILGWRPSKKLGASALSIPLLSVSALAWLYGNPFNGLVFFVFFVSLIILGSHSPSEKVDKAPIWAAVAGVMMIVFGWIYPHFVAGGSWLRYLYGAPAGLIPCPTLSFTIGFALLANGFSSRAFSLSLGALGLFYGLFGAFRLGVTIDIVLLAGAVALLVTAAASERSAKSRAEI